MFVNVLLYSNVTIAQIVWMLSKQNDRSIDSLFFAILAHTLNNCISKSIHENCVRLPINKIDICSLAFFM